MRCAIVVAGINLVVLSMVGACMLCGGRPRAFADDVIRPYVEVNCGRSTGAGVVVETPRGVRILTAAHVVEESDFAEIRKESGDKAISWQCVVDVRSGAADLALLRPRVLDDLHPCRVLPGPVMTGEDCWYIGTPYGLHASLERSVINRARFRNKAGDIHLLINGNATFGNSGGPVFVRRGNSWFLAGIVVKLVVPYSRNFRTPLEAETEESIRCFISGITTAMNP